VRTTLRRRFVVEITAGLLSGALLLVTLLWPDWLELVFGIDPDAGSGMAEWLMAASFFTLSVASGIAVRLEWRRSLAATT
jgi:hypothetical protein